MKKAYLVFLVCLVSIIQANAQTLIRYSVSTENLPVRFAAIQLCDVGGVHPRFMIAGTVGNDILLMKIRPNGDFISSWRIPYLDGTVRPIVTSMIVDADNSVVVAGYRDISTTDHNTNAFILRFNYSSGTLTFLNRYENTSSLFTRVLEPTGTGPFIVVGQNSPSSGAQDALIMQVDRTSGALTSVNDIDHTNSSDTYYSIIGNGTTFHTAARFTPLDAAITGHRPVITKWDASFNQLGKRYYITPSISGGGTGYDARMYGVDLVQVGKCVYMLVMGDDDGVQNSAGAFPHLYVVKALTAGDGLGNIFETRYDFGDAFDGRWHSIKETNSSSLMCLGSHSGPNGDDNLEDAFLMNMDLNGNPTWTQRYPFEIDNGATHPDALHVSGSFTRVVGFTHDYATTNFFGAVLTVFTSDGEVGCETTETPDLVQFDFDEEIDTFTNAADTDETTMTTSPSNLNFGENIICPVPRLENDEVMIEFSVEPVSIYPNPSGGIINVELNEYFKIKPKIEIFDCLGQLIATYQFEGKSTEIDLSQFGKGIFYIKVANDQKSFSNVVVIN